MTVQELIDRLSKFPGDMIILQPADGFGEFFAPVDEACTMFVDNNYKLGQIEEVWDKEDLIDDSDKEESEVFLHLKEVLVLWPE